MAQHNAYKDLNCFVEMICYSSDEWEGLNLTGEKRKHCTIAYFQLIQLFSNLSCDVGTGYTCGIYLGAHT